jgi:hypothetical protein
VRERWEVVEMEQIIGRGGGGEGVEGYRRKRRGSYHLVHC